MHFLQALSFDCCPSSVCYDCFAGPSVYHTRKFDFIVGLHLHVRHHLPGLLYALARLVQLLGALQEAVSLRGAARQGPVCPLPEQLCPVPCPEP